MHDYVIPDSVGDPIRAWRTWFVVPENQDSGELRLRSFVYRNLWELREPHVAKCDLVLCKPPDDIHRCGIYALSDRNEIETIYYGNPWYEAGSWTEIWRVMGEVALWGKIVPGERGYRAQYAYPLHIEVPERIKGREQLLSAKEIVTGLEHYGCEIELKKTTLDLREKSSYNEFLRRSIPRKR